MALSIFSLMGSIFVDSSAAEDSIKKTEEKSNKLSESFINGISTAGKWAAGIATAAGTAAVAIGSAAINVSTDVDKAMNDFAASTGTATEELEAYEKAMLNIYNNNFGESFEDISNAMGEVKSLMGDWMDAEGIEIMTQNALMLRDTFDFEVNESIRAANSLMNQFGIDGELAYSLIAQGAQNGLNQNGDLLDVVNEYSVQFAQMGYEAEDMFNMLANGAEEGTWSVDKLGDALKEFNIRTKDGSKTTADAFSALGLTMSDNSEALSKAREEAEKYESQIAKLEKNIKYAMMQQEGFNDKTSELTKVKTADSIATWSAELAKLKGDLSSTTESIANMEAQAAEGGQSANDLFARFAAGGEDAKEATQEVLAALKSMDDKVAQDAAGVALFGTMWEDLGADAVFAMMETEGAITQTADALEEINNIKYDDLGSMIEGLKRNFETLLLPLGNALIPLITQVVQLIQDNMPMIESMFAQLTPIITQLFESLLPPLMDLITSLLPPLMDIVNAVLPMLSSFLMAIIPLVVQIVESILPVFVQLIDMLLPPLMEIVNMILPILIQLITPLLSLMPVIINLLNPIIQLAMALIVPLMELLDIVLPPLIEIIKFLTDVTLARLQGTFQAVASIISNVVNVAVTYVKNQIDILKNIFSNIIEFFQNAFAGNWRAAFENLKNIVSNVFQGMINAVKTPINVIIGIINGLVSGVASGINGVIGALNRLKIDVPKWVTDLTGVSSFGFNLSTVSAPQIPLLAEGGTAIEEGSAIVGEAGAELIDLPRGARVTPLTENGDPIGYKAVANKLDTMISLLAAILEKEGNIHIGETQFVNYVNKSLGALL